MADVTPENALRGENKLKLGLFAINGSGAAFTNHPDRFAATWDNNLSIARAADAAGLEALVPYARWRGFGGPRHYSGRVFEPFAWAAAVSAVTTRICVMSTVHTSVYHPLVAAKHAATIDHISRGRFAMNIVCGWFGPEFDMFGTLPTHEDRYGAAHEWVDIVTRLWREEAPFDFDGTYFNLRGAVSDPQPLQEPGPMLMNAGGSAAGREFAAAHCDLAFVFPFDPDPEAIRQQVEEYRAMARDTYDRELQVWMSSYVVQRATDEEAAHYVDSYAGAYGDASAADAFIAENIKNAQTVPGDVMMRLRRELMAGVGGYALVGTAETIAQRLVQLSECGVDGVLLTWLDYERGLPHFVSGILPRLEAAGLRAPAKTDAA